MLSSEPDVSVIIVNFNTLSFLKKSLASIGNGFKRYRTEIIVVDNGSTDGSAEYVASLPDVRFISNEENLGFARANNQALGIMRGHHCFLLNSDAFLHESCGDLLIDFMLAHPEVGLVVPTFEYPDGRWQPSFGNIPSIWQSALDSLGVNHLVRAWYGLVDKRMHTAPKPRRVGYGEGAGLLIRDEVLQVVGGLSSEYHFYGDDADYCLRADKAGWQAWWLPEARITHVRGSSLVQKDFLTGVKAGFYSLIQFLENNYSPRTVRIIYILKCLYAQQMLMTVQLMSAIPRARKWVGDRLQKYRIVRDLYWSYLPGKKFRALIEEITLIR